MSLGVTVQVVVDGIVAASERRDWSTIQRLEERVRMIILDAVVDRDEVGLSEVAMSLSVAEALFAGATGDERLARVGWMLRSDATLAKLAARRVPSSRIDDREEDRSARDRILQALAGANTAPSVTSVAKMTGLARETVSRLLPMMAGEGLLRFRKVGRKTLSRITTKGRAAMGEAPGDIVTSIRNSHGVTIDLVMTATSAAQKRAHRMVAWNDRRQAALDVDGQQYWPDAVSVVQANPVDVVRGSPSLLGGDVLRFITNDGVLAAGDRVMRMTA